ncbi:MAG TPA: EAL domain-containing protein [Solirubrobacteraceae bacterium]|nr:EAL domain-containing protein [Solirubrobacteraceae bacterium]
MGAFSRMVSAIGRGRGLWAALAAMLVLAGVLGAVLGARSVARSDAGRQRLAAHLTANDVAATLKLAIRHEEDLTVSMSAFVASNPDVTPLAFDRWVESMHTLTRYPELQNVGLAKFVPASRLTEFEALMAARPLRPLGSRSAAQAGRLRIVPAGKRPYYCLAVAGMARSAASYLPAGLDYCALIKSMIGRRDSGLTGYAPLANAGSVTLGIETPVYRGGVLPSTVAARRRAFVGWLGELITPGVLLQTALAGHPNTAAVFRYDSSFSHIQFASGSLRGRAQRTTIALYAAKAAGKDRYTLFDTSMRAGEEGRIQLEADLNEALTHEQFFLLFQPIFDLSSHEIVAAEALVRWHHPTRGVIDPEGFIPLAEENGQIAPIGQWVLDRACRQAAAWAAEHRDIGIAVNVSAYQLGRKGFAQDVQRALETSGAKPSSITLEITETTLMRDVPAACERLQELKALGVRLAIDDFGTGYASLSHLQDMPVDILKIDRSFIAALDHGPQGRDLLQAILGIAQSLSLSVIAEGIEQHSQLGTLEQLGCQMAQGFLLGNPLPAQDLAALLAFRARRAGDAAQVSSH